MFLRLFLPNPHPVHRESGIYHILGISGQEAADVFGGDVHDAASGLHCGPGHMGRDDAVFGGQQGIVCRDGLCAHHIHGGCPELSCVQGIGHILLVDESAPAVVDENGAAFAHTVILGLMEAKASEITDGSQGFSLIGRHNALCRILDYLLPEGPLFRSEYYDGTEQVDESDAEFLDVPMAVLVNSESISAAEFFAAALSEYEAATVVGQQTIGKGYFQQAYELSDGSAVGLSVGKYTTPNGVSLAGVGITPDVIVEMPEEQKSMFFEIGDLTDVQLGEAYKVALDMLK